MPQDRAAVPTDTSKSIKVPDQLQQSNSQDGPRACALDAVRTGRRDAPAGGILHELKTERAHD